MNLREALDRCSDAHASDWVQIPGGWGRPATTMVAGIFDQGGSTPDTRPLLGHSLALYEPDPRLALVWLVPEDTNHLDRPNDRSVPEWAEQDPHEFKNTRDGWVVVLLAGAPIWQARLWYLDWGSGIGGYVPDFQPRFGRGNPGGSPQLEGWEVSTWEIGLARLVNSFSHNDDTWFNVDPTPRVVPSPTKLHPLDAARRAG